MKKYLQKNYFNLIILSIFIILFCVITNKTFSNFFLRYSYELQGPFTYDTTMYYAIGKGLTHDLIPYQDLFETKPPMIFFLSALSYKLTNDFYLCNIISFIILLLTSLSVTIFLIIKIIIDKNKNFFIIIPLILTSLTIGFLLGGYDQLRSGEVQVELFGAGFIILYIVLINFIDIKKVKSYSPLIIISSIFLMIGIMFKEPFLLVSIACALLLCKDKKELFYKLLLPLIYGGISGILILIVTRTFIPYISIYLKHMLTNHINIYGSPLERMLHIEKSLGDLGNYSGALLGLILVMFTLTLISIFNEKNEETNKTYFILKEIYRYIKPIVAILLVSFSVGLGGQYYNHHFIFALPLYITLSMISLLFLYEHSKSFTLPTKETNFLITQGITLSLFITSLSGLYLLPKFSYNEKILFLNQTMKDDALYVDKVLDYYDEETYQYFGFNGPIFYAYTTHDPLGPVFFQDPNNFHDENNFFVNNLKEQMDKANIFFVRNINCGVMNEYITTCINENFQLIDKQIEKELEKPTSFTYKSYIRIK